MMLRIWHALGRGPGEFIYGGVYSASAARFSIWGGNTEIFLGGIVQGLQKFSIIADIGLDEWICISSNEIKREPCENTKPSFKSQKVRNINAQLKVPHMKTLSELKLSESCVNHL